MHKAGFISIIGKPNVGKSSLLNALMGEKLSAVTHKAQTTRHRIFGLLNTDDYQLVLSDTPGLIKPAYTMQEGMMKFVQESMKDADVFLLMTDVIDTFDFIEILEKLKKTKTPVVVAINKSDLSTQEDITGFIKKWEDILPNAIVIPISALHLFNLERLIDTLVEFIPVHPPYYPKEDISNLPLRFFTAEIIREKIFLNFEKEIPYSVEIEIEKFEEEERITKIYAIINVLRPSQRAIILGHKGNAIKKVGTEARKDIEKLLDKKVYLELYVKVLKDWRDDKRLLKNFGYE